MSAGTCLESLFPLAAKSTAVASSSARHATNSCILKDTDAPAANQTSGANLTLECGGQALSNMNRRTREKVYRFLVSRDGECCAKCKRSGNQVKLVIDHIDNNNCNNRPDNLQLLCRRCNYQKNPRGSKKQPFDSCVCECPPKVTFRYLPNEIQINQCKEPLFRQYVQSKIDTLGEFELDDLINSGAEKVGVSIVTAGRYITKMCSSEGTLAIVTRANTECVIKRKSNSNT